MHFSVSAAIFREQIETRKFDKALNKKSGKFNAYFHQNSKQFSVSWNWKIRMIPKKFIQMLLFRNIEKKSREKSKSKQKSIKIDLDSNRRPKNPHEKRK